MSHERSLKIATFNVWHGLAGRGIVRFREFEEPHRRDERFQLALRTLFDLDPDILLLQELNPVSKQGRELTRVLGGEFLGRIDQSGLKFLAHGFPRNLATGLGIVVRGSVRALESVENGHGEHLPSYVRLSGSIGFSGERLSLQLGELRYAQFHSVIHPALGRLLICNTHLHHGFERFPGLMELLDAAVNDGRIASADYTSLLTSLDQARARRLHEVDRLLEIIHRFEDQHDGVLIGGDLNSTPEGAAYHALLADGFDDLAATPAGRKNAADGPTWDPVSNVENHRIQCEVGFDFPLPTFGNEEFTKIYRAFDQQSRRIDFLLGKGTVGAKSVKMIRADNAAEPIRLTGVQRFGFPPSKNALAPSDHFGLIATFSDGRK